MADEIDLANDMIDKEIAYALGKRKQSAQNAHAISEHCQECGDTIPEQRRSLGFGMCIICATESERRQSLFVE